MHDAEYKVIKNEHNGNDVYGLQIRCLNGEIRVYRFVSPFACDVQDLIRQMSTADIAPVHFDDIVADYMKKLFIDKLFYNGLGRYAF